MSMTEASTAKPAKRAVSGSNSVEAYLAALDHPFKEEILALRQVILGVDPSIGEAIKWNAPSFYTSEYFATMHLRSKDGVQVILHLGAKTRDQAPSGVVVADPQGLLQWLAKDRASVTFGAVAQIEASRDAFADIIRQWITYV